MGDPSELLKGLLHRRRRFCRCKPLLLPPQPSWPPGSEVMKASRRLRAAEYIREIAAYIRSLPPAPGASRRRRGGIYRRLPSPLVAVPRRRRRIAEACGCRGARWAAAPAVAARKPRAFDFRPKGKRRANGLRTRSTEYSDTLIPLKNVSSKSGDTFLQGKEEQSSANSMQVSPHVHDQSLYGRKNKFAKILITFGEISKSHLNFVQIH